MTAQTKNANAAAQPQTPAAPAHPLPQPIVARPHNDLAGIAKSVEAASLTDDQRERLYRIIEEAAGSSKKFEVALTYLKAQTQKDGKIYAAGAYRLGEIALYRLASFGSHGMASEYIKTMHQIGLPAKAILQRFMQAAFYYFGGRVEAPATEDAPRLYDREKSIVVFGFPRKAAPTVSLLDDYDSLVLSKAKAALNADKRTVFKHEYRQQTQGAPSPLHALLARVASVLDALEYAPKNADKPNKGMIAAQAAIRADFAQLGIDEKDFCQSYLAPLVAYYKKLKEDNKDEQPAAK